MMQYGDHIRDRGDLIRRVVGATMGDDDFAGPFRPVQKRAQQVWQMWAMTVGGNDDARFGHFSKPFDHLKCFTPGGRKDASR